MKMCDKELLVAYLYEDLADMDRARFDRHLRECAVCRDEVTALGGVRADLAAWTAPHPDFGFRIVQERKSSWRAWWSPAFGLAAAAIIVLAAASALARVQVTYGQGSVVIRSGWSSAPTAAPQPAMLDASTRVNRPTEEKDELRAPITSNVSVDALADISRRLRALETAARPSPVHQVVSAGARISDAEILRQVRELVAQSESRQLQELALRIVQVIRDVDAQRLADLTRIQQGFGRIDALTTAEAVAHRDLANYILTSSKQQK